MAELLAIRGGRPLRTRPYPTWPIFGEEEEQALVRALRSGKWGRTAGDEVARFEQQFAQYHQAKHGVAVANGTVALRIAMMAAEIRAGDEVIVPPYTFLATASAVVEANATPIFADLELETFNLCPRAAEAAVTPRTRIVMPVHLGGLSVNMDAMMDLARRRNLVVIEDACHAHGAEYKGRRLGAIGHMGVFSFQSSKNLTSGEGGIILTNDDDLAARCRSIQNCGRVPGGAWYEHHTIGGNHRLAEFQGALLSAQFQRFEAQATTREANGKHLDERLSRVPGIRPQVRTTDCTRHAYHLFSLRVECETIGMVRDAFVEALVAEGIPAMAGYKIPLYRQPLFTNLAFGPYTGSLTARPDLDYRKVSCPNCERICYQEGVWIEPRAMLGTREDMDDIAAAIEKIYANRDAVGASR